jgi:zona occludens toxin
MIRLFTGLPGHGKTLRVVSELMALRAQDSSRPLYVRGITGLTLDHATCEGHDWCNLPDGSIVVIDEAQQIFPVRRSGDPADYIRNLATHRHRGIDIWLITQHPSLIDTFARKLIDRHTHVFRVASSEFAQVYEWGEVQDDPRSMAAREVSESHTWKYPKEVYGAYSSAVLHTAKARIPKKVVMLGVVVVLAFVCVFTMWSWASDRISPEPDVVQSKPNLQPASALVKSKPIQTAQDWLAMYQPRVAYRPESAPIYDKQMQTAAPPRLVCIDVEGLRCQCYTEQATPWEGVKRSDCEKLARTGIYAPSRVM